MTVHPDSINARSPERATNICAFLLTLTYMDVAKRKVSREPDYYSDQAAQTGSKRFLVRSVFLGSNPIKFPQATLDERIGQLAKADPTVTTHRWMLADRSTSQSLAPGAI